MRAGSATLPEWLRPEWVEPVVRGGERLGTIVVLPELSQGRTGRRALHSPAATLGTGGESSGSVGPIIGGSEALRNAAEKARRRDPVPRRDWGHAVRSSTRFPACSRRRGSVSARG